MLKRLLLSNSYDTLQNLGCFVRFICRKHRNYSAIETIVVYIHGEINNVLKIKELTLKLIISVDFLEVLYIFFGTSKILYIGVQYPS